MKWAMAVFTFGFWACASRGSGQGDLTSTAARDLDCPKDDIELNDVSAAQDRLLHMAGGSTHAYARGCGKRLVYVHLCKADSTGECDWYSVKKLRNDQLLDRVSFDAKCPKAQITTVQVSPNTVGARACGQQATYVWSCPHNQDFFSP